MNLEEERKKLVQATVEALRAAWPMTEAGRASPSLGEADNPELYERRGAAPPRGRAARAHDSRNRSSRRD